MRKLTAQQKKVIDRAIIADRDLRSWDDLPYEVREQLEKINNTEILWSETNRYIWDKRMDAVHNSSGMSW